LGIGLVHLSLCTPLGAASTVTTFQLSNGLRVIMSPLNHMEATCVMLYHLTGVRDDTPAVRGGSYLYQDLMVRATRNLDRYERLLFIKRSGGISDRIVNYDYSVFYQVVPETEVNNALWLESERISSLQLTTRNINAEKNKVYTRNYRLNNSNINVRSLNWIKSKIFAGTIYASPVYGDLEKIRDFDTQAVRRLYNNFRNLSNIIIVVAGKFDPAEIRRAVSKHFAALAAPPRQPRRSYELVSPRTKYEYENWQIENLAEPFVLYAFRAPSKFSHDYLFFDFLRYYLVDERISKLETLLNHDNNLEASVSYYFTNHHQANALVIKIACKKRADLSRAKYFFNKLLDSLKKGRPGAFSGSDIKNTRDLMEIDFLKQMTSLPTRCEFLAENYHFSGNIHAEARHLERIRNINAYDIYRISKKYLDKKNRVNLNVFKK
jgi:zinc protease